MNTTLPSPFQLTRLTRQALSHLADGQRKIQRIAAFVVDDANAQRLVHRLRTEVPLPSVQMVVLRPADGQQKRFKRAMRVWAGLREPDRGLRPEHRILGATLGGVVAGMLAWLMTLLDPGQPATAVMSALVVGLLWGAAVGLLVVVLLERLPKLYRFDHKIQRTLKDGGFAVVVVQVPAECQAEVLALVRGNCRGWCAEAPRAPRRGWLFRAGA